MMWSKIKANPAAFLCFLAIVSVTFILKVPAVKASQFHDALEWLQSGLATIAVLALRALFGADADAVQKALAGKAAEKTGGGQ